MSTNAISDKLYIKILIAIVLAVIVGYLTNKQNIWGLRFYSAYGFLGELFLNALRMMIVPLITTSIITSIGNFPNNKSIGQLSWLTIVYYIITSFIVIVLGVVLVMLIKPGYISGQAAKHLLGLSDLNPDMLQHLSNHGVEDLFGIFLRMVPVNIIKAAADGELLGLILFSFLFGFFITKLPDDKKVVMRNFWEDANTIAQNMVILILKFAPIGIFGLVAKTVANTGFASFIPLLKFFFTVLLGLAIHAFILLPLLLFFVAKRAPWKYVRAVSPALLTAFSTASSSATLPVTLESIIYRTNISPAVSKFVLPIGATVNMDGTALYECVAALFLIQAYGVKITFLKAVMVILLALLTSIGVAGIPAASLVAIGVILMAVGLPLQALGVLLITDRILDMCRTTVNVWSDTCCTAIVARLSGNVKLTKKR